MSQPVGVRAEEGAMSKVPSSDSSALSENSTQENSGGLKEHDYIGLSEVSSSMESSVLSSQDGEESNLNLNLNLKATELRLGLPGSLSPVRDEASPDPELSLMGSSLKFRTDVVEEKNLFPIEKQQQHSTKEEDRNGQDKYNMQSSRMGSGPKGIVSGAKRGFSEAMESRSCFGEARNNGGFSSEGKWMFPSPVMNGSELELPKANGPQGKFMASAPAASKGPTAWHAGGLEHSGSSSPFMSSRPSAGTITSLNAKSVKEGAASIGVKDLAQQPKMSQERPRNEAQLGANQNQMPAANDPAIAPAAKSRVVGWPPVRTFRKNTLVTVNSKNADESEGKAGSSALYVKVSMDGAPYLRKVDLKMYSRYPELSTALEKMFSCFTIGQCGSHGVPGRDGLSESKLMDLLHGSEYVLTYEDKDGDWMLVGDVPWEMFIDSCKRLRIMKGSEAIGLAPRAMEKCKNRN